MSGFETIRVETGDDGVALLTLNRPEVRNAIDLRMVEETHAALAALARDGAARVLVITGAGGKAFVSGADIAELRERGRADALASINQGLVRAVEEHPLPTIAAVAGWALGGGCELAIACDLRVAGEGARFGQPEVGLGIVPAAGGTKRLARLVGLGRAKELIFTGRIVEAAEALAIGLVNRVVPDAEVVPAARALAAEIAKNDALALRLAKVAVHVGAGAVDAASAVESAAQAICFESDAKRARMTAFLEAREARRKKGPGKESGR